MTAAASWLDRLSAAERERVRAADPPRTPQPMLATLTYTYFSDPRWIYERKLDGQRCFGFRRADADGGEVRLASRAGNPLTATYPEIAEALGARAGSDVVVDGEIVAFEGGGTSFSRLQQRMGVTSATRARALAGRIAVTYYVFDLLYLDGHDVTRLPLRTRKSLLRRALPFGDPLRFTSHRNTEGERCLGEACRRGWEGVIAKRADSPYAHRRSGDWLKFKCGRRQELVIGGFTEPEGGRTGFGALLIGYYEGEELRYAGKVGTGYDRRTLRDLRERMDHLAVETQPFSGPAVRERSVHWIRPELVAEIGFAEWTGDGKLRHPRFIGLRTDKPARDVVRERPREAGTPGTPGERGRSGGRGRSGTSGGPRRSG